VDLVSLGCQTDLALLRFAGADIDDRGDHLVIRSPHNPGHWWGNYLLLAGIPAPEESEQWLDRFAAEFPHARHVALGFDGKAGEATDLQWFAKKGMNVEAQAVMTAPVICEPGHVNRDCVCRPLASEDDWAQSVGLRMRCRDLGREPASYLAYSTAGVQAHRRMVGAGHGVWFGAFLDGLLVCQMGLFSALPGVARFQSVETDPACRRLGLAGTLLYFAGGYGFGQLGARTLVICADPKYFAVDLYRAVGFAPCESQLQAELPPPDP
jgi:GNAT superfamily N-acetyltransferase